jgi:hypothetical protein
MFQITHSHRAKLAAATNGSQPTSLVPIKRGDLAHKNVFTMGSCFALEVRHRLAGAGYATFPKYFDISFDPNRAMVGKLPERDNINHYSVAAILQEFENIAGPKPVFSPEYFVDLSADETIARQIRLFVRTIRRGLLGKPQHPFKPMWQDPFRKQTYAVDRETIEQVSNAVTDKIREGAERADLFIMTLGMTETWVDKKSGLTVCNSYGHEVNERLFEFKDLSFADTRERAARLVRTLRAINPKADIVFTVSPLPLQRTAKNESVIVANTLSKAKQRAAVAEVCDEFENVFYFPSFELSRDPDFYADNGAHVRPEKVAHIVESFARWYGG